mgnify:CR=1 FL=1
MKKVLAITLAAVCCLTLVFSLAACKGGSGKYAEMQAQVASLQQTMEEQGLNMTITGDGNKLIYTYTYPSEVPDVMGDALESALQAQSSTFESIAETLKQAVDVDNPVVVVRYLSSDGTEICSMEFGA